MTENDIRNAANELLGKEGEDWRMITRGEDERSVVFDHQIPVRKRVDFHLGETKYKPIERIQEWIDYSFLDIQNH